METRRLQEGGKENEEREEEERKAKCLLAQNKINMLTKILKLMQKFNDKNTIGKGKKSTNSLQTKTIS